MLPTTSKIMGALLLSVASANALSGSSAVTKQEAATEDYDTSTFMTRTTTATGTGTTATKPSVTSWTLGACTLGHVFQHREYNRVNANLFYRSMSVPELKCKSTTAPPFSTSACHCPDGAWYEGWSGDTKGPCYGHSTAQGDLQVAAMTACPTPTPTAASSASETPTYGLATQVVVGAPPTICKSADYAYETKMSVPSGWVFIHAGHTGWGPEGSVWNISTGGGAKLTQVKAQCQGSSCMGYSGDPLASSQTKQRSDGSWYLKVTPNMQPSLSISGLLLPIDPGTSNYTDKQSLNGRDSSNDTITKYPLDILGTPPCGQYIAVDCSDPTWRVTPKLWQAYKMDEFLKTYLSKKNIKSFDGLMTQSIQDFEPPSDVDGQFCDFSGNFQCHVPDRSECLDAIAGHPLSTSDDVTRGMILTITMAQFTNFIGALYIAIEGVANTIDGFLSGVVANVWQPAAQATWTKIMSLASSILGVFLITLGVIVSAVPGFAPLAGVLTTAATVASGAFGLAGSIGSLDPGSADTQFFQSAGYQIGAQNQLNNMQQGLINGLYKNDAVGRDGISSLLAGGLWVDPDVHAAFTDVGFGAKATNWFGKLMIAQYSTKALTDNDAFILFIPYGDDVPYNGEAKGFSKDICERTWVNDPSWKYTAFCDVTMGPNGQAGMSLFTRPSNKNSESESWDKNPLDYHNTNYTTFDIIKSSMWGQQIHGFNYTLLGNDLADSLVKEGPSAVATKFENLPMDEPGLFNVPVCVVKDLVYVPGVWQVMADAANSKYFGNYFRGSDPCPCADYSYKSPDGKSGKFTDFVSKNVKDSIGDGCKVYRPNTHPSNSGIGITSGPGSQ